jgi:predicted nucleotidyltransferase
MTERSGMLCVPPTRPLNPIAVSVIREVDAVAQALHLSYCLIGAMARDVLLGHVFGLDTGRATRDMDFAFALEGWEQFQQLQERLMAGGHFVAVRDLPHRLLFRPGSKAQEYMVDLLPFGGVEQPLQTIAWPPDMQILMNVAGYRDVLETAPLVQVAPGLIMRIVSLPGLAMLKLFAWQDRGREGGKDAIDLFTLCQRYADAGNLERLYDEGLSALQAVEFNVELAGAWLLGKDMAATASPQTRVQLQGLLRDAHVSQQLVNDMVKAVRSREDAVIYAEQLLDQFTRGFASEVDHASNATS